MWDLRAAYITRGTGGCGVDSGRVRITGDPLSIAICATILNLSSVFHINKQHVKHWFSLKSFHIDILFSQTRKLPFLSGEDRQW